jgi:gephyrin
MALISRLRAAIIIVSETAFKDATTDKGIPALRATFADRGGDQWLAEDTQIVRDDVLDIQRAITQRTDGKDPVNLIVTSGGTGFAQKDLTPEVSGTRFTVVKHVRY